LISAEALALGAPGGFPPPPTEVLAAADLTAHVLRAIAADYAEAEDLLQGSQDLAVAVPM
jgi:hypothetical protein